MKSKYRVAYNSELNTHVVEEYGPSYTNLITKQTCGWEWRTVYGDEPDYGSMSKLTSGTTSIGVVDVPIKRVSKEEAIKKLDEYRAKEKEQNKIESSWRVVA